MRAVFASMFTACAVASAQAQDRPIELATAPAAMSSRNIAAASVTTKPGNPGLGGTRGTSSIHRAVLAPPIYASCKRRDRLRKFGHVGPAE